MGARSIHREIHNQFKSYIASEIVNGNLSKGGNIGISVENDKFSFEVTPKKIYHNSNNQANPICPSCNSSMVLRKARRGKYAGKHFYGCKNYPQCYGIVNI